MYAGMLMGVTHYRGEINTKDSANTEVFIYDELSVSIDGKGWTSEKDSQILHLSYKTCERAAK